MILDIAVLSIKNGPLLVSRLDLITGADTRLSDARRPLPHGHNASEIDGLGEAQLSALLQELQSRLVVHNGVLVVTQHGGPVFANP